MPGKGDWTDLGSLPFSEDTWTWMIWRQKGRCLVDVGLWHCPGGWKGPAFKQHFLPHLTAQCEDMEGQGGGRMSGCQWDAAVSLCSVTRGPAILA